MAARRRNLFCGTRFRGPQRPRTLSGKGSAMPTNPRTMGRAFAPRERAPRPSGPKMGKGSPRRVTCAGRPSGSSRPASARMRLVANTLGRPRFPPSHQQQLLSNYLPKGKRGSSHRMRGRPTLGLAQGPESPLDNWRMAFLSAVERQRMTRPKKERLAINALIPDTAHAAITAAGSSPWAIANFFVAHRQACMYQSTTTLPPGQKRATSSWSLDESLVRLRRRRVV